MAVFDLIQSASVGTTASSFTASFGATPVEGNTLIAVVFYRNEQLNPDISGWTQILDQPVLLDDSAARRHTRVFQKIAGASESTDVTVTFDAQARGVLIIQEREGELEVDQSATADSGTSQVSSQSTGTTNTTTEASELAMAMVGVRHGDPGTFSWTNSFGSVLSDNTGLGDTHAKLELAFLTLASTQTVESTASWATAEEASGAMLTFNQVSTTSSTSLLATGDGTITDVVDEADAGTGLFDSVDDDPVSPDDADWVNNAIDVNGGDASVFFDITNPPTDFGNAETASVEIRVKGQDFSGSGLVTDDFTGTNGDPWDPNIWLDQDLDGGASTIQNNEGQLEVADVDDVARQLTEAPHEDFDALFKQYFAGGFDEDKRFGFEFRRPTDWQTVGSPDAPLTGYQLHHQQGTDRIRLYRFDSDGTVTVLATDTTIDRTLTYWFRIVCVGSSIQVRWWEDGTAEPSTWNFDVTEGTYLTGEAFSLTHWRGAGSNPRQALVDDLNIDITSGADTIKLYAQLFQSDEATTMSDEVEVVSISTDDTFTNYQATFTGLDTTSGKSVWDNARVRFRWSAT